MLPRNHLPIFSPGDDPAVLTICHAKPYIGVDNTNDYMEKLNREPFFRKDWADWAHRTYVLNLENYQYNRRNVCFQQEIGG
jgi:hypothetical protein